MKGFIKVSMLLIVGFFLLKFNISVYAAGAVSYDGDANKFFFVPGTDDSLTSLFDHFQDVMPGDTITDQILIKNDTSNEVKIEVYMRSLGAKEKTDDFLSQMKLIVQQEDDSILFEAAADEPAQLVDWVHLGTVYSGGEIVLNVTLEVPITIDNDYQNKIGYVDWEFKVEEFQIEASDPQLPQTGDENRAVLYLSLVPIAFFALLFLLYIKKCNNKKISKNK